MAENPVCAVKGHDWGVQGRTTHREPGKLITVVTYKCKRCPATNTVTSEKSD